MPLEVPQVAQGPNINSSGAAAKQPRPDVAYRITNIWRSISTLVLSISLFGFLGLELNRFVSRLLPISSLSWQIISYAVGTFLGLYVISHIYFSHRSSR